jgi:hypothetical protein
LISLHRPDSNADEGQKKLWAELWFKQDRKRVKVLHALPKLEFQISMLEGDSRILTKIAAVRDAQPLYENPYEGITNPALDTKFTNQTRQYELMINDLTTVIRQTYQK